MSYAASPSSNGGSDPLDLTSLDADSLFAALGAVEKAIPDLLLSVKPVFAHLTSAAPDQTSDEASEAIEAYMTILDKIQFVLRQTVYYLRETRASTSALRPPPTHAIPTPFAAGLPDLAAGAGPGAPLSGPSGEREAGPSRPPRSGEGGGAGIGEAAGAGVGDVGLGLYGSRVELGVLTDLQATLGRLKAELRDDGRGAGGAGAAPDQAVAVTADRAVEVDLDSIPDR